MGLILLILLLILILGGIGIWAAKLLLWIALILLVLWLIGFFVRGRKAHAGTAGSGSARQAERLSEQEDVEA